MEHIMNQVFFGNTVYEYARALIAFIAALLVIKIVQYIVLQRLKKWSQNTSNSIDDFFVGMIEKLAIPLSYFAAFYFSFSTLQAPDSFKHGVQVLGIALITILTARFVNLLVQYGFHLYSVSQGRSADLRNSLDGILKVVKFLVWSLALILFLDNMGFKISTVIAGLGIGGIAIGLAAQAVLKDLFSYFSIIFDRPFEVGDFIIIGDYLGTVEKIGAKTTHIRSLGGEQLIFSNSDLTDSRVRNYKRMRERRVVFKLGVVYQTPIAQVREIPRIIQTVIKNTPDTRFDRAHFFSYGDFALIFEVVYYVLSADYNIYMDIQQAINFGIKEEFEKRNIEFAYPTQTLYVNKETAA
ncbi:MAG: mechanosensitive ion channel family protein [Candidatus Omnitrophica bacterium]|nr:mechanosensitive ion channel family protein [Candidatus Omnitrophota bacterium]